MVWSEIDGVGAAGSRSCRILHGIKIDEEMKRDRARQEKAKPTEPRSRPRLDSLLLLGGSGAGPSFSKSAGLDDIVVTRAAEPMAVVPGKIMAGHPTCR